MEKLNSSFISAVFLLLLLLSILLFDCLFLSFHVRDLERIYTQELLERQGTPCSKQARYLKFK